MGLVDSLSAHIAPRAEKVGLCLVLHYPSGYRRGYCRPAFTSIPWPCCVKMSRRYRQRTAGCARRTCPWGSTPWTGESTICRACLQEEANLKIGTLDTRLTQLECAVNRIVAKVRVPSTPTL